MAFTINDFERRYVIRGTYEGLFNVARSDEANDSPRYYAFLNDTGSYIIQRIVITAGIGVYTYYANNGTGSLNDDWDNRATLTYQEYNKIL